MHEVAQRALDIAYYDVAYRDEGVLDALMTYGDHTAERAEDLYRSEIRPRIARAVARRRRQIVAAARNAPAGADLD
ncbi:MAG: hypothetical protein KGM44_09800 [bacterium]|nr:hypothetical protein [bacterium]